MSQWRMIAVRYFINWPFANLWRGRSPIYDVAVRLFMVWPFAKKKPFAGWLSGRSSGRSLQILRLQARSGHHSVRPLSQQMNTGKMQNNFPNLDTWPNLCSKLCSMIVFWVEILTVKVIWMNFISKRETRVLASDNTNLWALSGVSIYFLAKSYPPLNW